MAKIFMISERRAIGKNPFFVMHRIVKAMRIADRDFREVVSD
jgi:hypothetical protein